MALLIPWSEVIEKAGETTIDLRNHIARESLKKSCALRAKYPTLTNMTILSTGFFRHLCSYFEEPPPFFSPPFTGGNCPELYSASGYYVEDNQKRGCGEIGTWTTGSGFVLGPIQGIDPNPAANGSVLGANNSQRPLIVSPNIDGCMNTSATVSKSQGNCNINTPKCTPLASVEQRFIAKVELASGGVDDCGDSNPPPPDPPPDIYDFQFQLTYNNVDVGGNSIDFDAFVEVEVNPNLELKFQFDVGGVKLHFSYNGVEEGDSFTFTGNDTAPNAPPQAPPPSENPDLDEEVVPPTEPNEQDEIERLAWVTIDITGTPSNQKNQWGGGIAPDVIYVGWFEFKSKGAYFPRQPIHFTKNIFEAPLGSDGYAFTLYSGVEGFATIYTTKV